jgi:DNA primase
VEGNMDVIMSHQAGVDNTVGTSGTAMTPSHLKLLSRYTDKLDFCFDTDQAGAMATRRGIGLALAGNFNIRVVQIKDKECKDPADYVKKYGKKWIETVKDSKPVLEYYFEKAKESYEPNSSVSKKNLIIYLAPFIKRLASQIERTHWISQLALFLRVSEQDIKADIQLAKDDLDQYTAPQEQKPVSRETKKTTFDFDLLEEAVLSLILKDPVLFKEEQKNIPPDCMTEQLSDLIKKIYSKDLKVHQIEKMIEKLPEEEKMKMEFALLKSQEFWNGFEEDELRVEFGSLIMKLKQRGVTSQLAALQFDIKDAEQKGDREQLKKLAAKFSKLTGELAQIYK